MVEGYSARWSNRLALALVRYSLSSDQTRSVGRPRFKQRSCDWLTSPE